MHFTFGSPWFLLLLLLLPCFWFCQQHRREFYFSKHAWIGKDRLLLNLDLWLVMLLYILLVFALAKPFLYESGGAHTKKGRDLVLALDASGSMSQSGFDPKDRFKTKYDTVLDIAQHFIDKRFDDNMGIVIFGTFAYTASPLTYDLHSLAALMKMTNVGIAGESTAIGDALMQSLKTLSFGEADHKVVVLLTDGRHNAGTHSPKEAVARAKAKKVRIYTIGVGAPGDYDGALLETIAKETGGKSFRASDAEMLNKIFRTIDTLEPSPIRAEHYLGQRLLIWLPLLLALGLLIWLDHRARKEMR